MENAMFDIDHEYLAALEALKGSATAEQILTVMIARQKRQRDSYREALRKE